MDRATKELSLGQIKEAFTDVQSIVLVEYAGLTVPTVTAMRDDFRKAGCQYRVLKNSLVKIAVKGSKMEPMSKLLKGPTAVIWSTETPQAPAKVALKWAKDQPKLVVKGGYFDGQVLDAKGIDALAKMPGKPEMQSTLLMTFLAAPTDFVRTIIAGPQNFLYLVDARRRQQAGE
ncbi:MAG: 50S ribosomal protein L10 [Kofleriaceae bacterium]|jgi:large subunit ribosomal protein L10|nr:50S ribosomal protein L10 [Kofleriaceae bacterium]MBP6836770.1 50S ribosomal protein L10 [Kofleriaceae bacterium]MBP9206464.1 50S ribosomal protein L10 [Kofleriaceae bacterium]